MRYLLSIFLILALSGYCFGGAAVLEFARSGADLKGFATFHGGLKTPEGQDREIIFSAVLRKWR